MKTLYTIFLSLFLLTISLKAQDADTTIQFKSTEDESFWEKMIFGEWDFEKHSRTIIIEESSPTIEGLYGKSSPVYYKSPVGDFKEMNTLEIRLGFTNLHRLNMNTSVVKYDYGYGYLNNALENLGSTTGNGILRYLAFWSGESRRIRLFVRSDL